LTPEETAAALEQCRVRIDTVDRDLVALLNERARIVETIGDLKQAQQMRVYEPKREEAVIANITASNRGPLTPQALKRIYERVMDEMRTLQRDRMAAKNQEPNKS
jgi:chorismate mutase-like protein